MKWEDVNSSALSSAPVVFILQQNVPLGHQDSSERQPYWREERGVVWENSSPWEARSAQPLGVVPRSKPGFLFPEIKAAYSVVPDRAVLYPQSRGDRVKTSLVPRANTEVRRAKRKEEGKQLSKQKERDCAEDRDSLESNREGRGGEE